MSCQQQDGSLMLLVAFELRKNEFISAPIEKLYQPSQTSYTFLFPAEYGEQNVSIPIDKISGCHLQYLWDQAQLQARLFHLEPTRVNHQH
jgi:hypothetical protein